MAHLGEEIVPKVQFARLMNSNLANYERAVREIDRFKLAISLPIWVVGIEPELHRNDQVQTKEHELEQLEDFEKAERHPYPKN
jgi:hypothetical protein